MRILSWNVKGLNASDKRGRIKKFLDSSKVDIILLQESKLSQDSFDNIISKWCLWKVVHVPSLGASGGLITL